MNKSVFDWQEISFVVFDVDGTLYNQKLMRFRMLREMVNYSFCHFDILFFKILKKYRELREEIGEAEAESFEAVLVDRTAKATGVDQEVIRATVIEWMEKRPLRHIRACRYAAVDEVFAALRRRGKIIGVFSDYPAAEKLAAMGLRADHVIAAGDHDVGILKPHPRGLDVLMQRAGMTPEQTILIGDRPERDGEAARRAGVAALIRSDKPIAGWTVFSRFSDPLFAPLLKANDQA